LSSSSSVFPFSQSEPSLEITKKDLDTTVHPAQDPQLEPSLEITGLKKLAISTEDRSNLSPAKINISTLTRLFAPFVLSLTSTLVSLNPITTLKLSPYSALTLGKLPLNPRVQVTLVPSLMKELRVPSF